MQELGAVYSSKYQGLPKHKFKTSLHEFLLLTYSENEGTYVGTPTLVNKSSKMIHKINVEYTFNCVTKRYIVVTHIFLFSLLSFSFFFLISFELITLCFSVCQIGETAVKSFYCVFFTTDEIRTSTKIFFCYIAMFTAAKPK